MSKGRESAVVLLIDDEPEYLAFVVDYLESLGLKTEIARNLPEAMAAIDRNVYRLILVDMEIPALGADAVVKRPSAVAHKYPGIVAAIHCRNQGYGAHQVIAYTVHDDDAADAELRKLNCRYVLKGRPEALKRVIQSSLGSKPPSEAGKGGHRGTPKSRPRS